MSDERTRAEQAIREAQEHVAKMHPSPGQRELTTRLDTFKRAVEAWGTAHHPSAQEVDALLKSVGDVRRLAIGTAPTLRRRRVEE